MCGVTKCKYCDVNLIEEPCHDTNLLGLDKDRDMDKSDIRYCPPGYTHAEFINYSQIISPILYLRVCSPITEPLDSHQLVSVNWNFDQFDNINEQMRSFDATIDRLSQKCFSTRTKRIGNSHFHKPWIIPAISKSIKTKSNLFELYRQRIISRNVNDACKKMFTTVIGC